MAAFPDAARALGLTATDVSHRPQRKIVGRMRRRRSRVAALSVVAAHLFAVAALWQERAVLRRPAEITALAIIQVPRHGPPPPSPEAAPRPPVLARLTFRPPELPELPAVAAPLPVAPPSAARAVSVQSWSAAAKSAPLADELAVYCPRRSAPAYPSQSRHLGEQGEVTLRVELDERGRVDGVTVIRSSGQTRLDEAARAAVLTWQCNAATREGQPIRAVATQTLEFVLTRR